MSFSPALTATIGITKSYKSPDLDFKPRAYQRHQSSLCAQALKSDCSTLLGEKDDTLEVLHNACGGATCLACELRGVEAVYHSVYQERAIAR
jgi:hypothetical protein